VSVGKLDETARYCALEVGLRDCAEAESRADEEGTKHAGNRLGHGGIGCPQASCNSRVKGETWATRTLLNFCYQ
jgi:hypothetical protein